jgi:hypothetical protein
MPPAPASTLTAARGDTAEDADEDEEGGRE